MKKSSLLTALAALVLGVAPAGAVDYTKIDRTIAKEPAYESKPLYLLMVLGPEARTRVWLVLDGDLLYVDRNGNGDLTEKRECKEARRIHYANQKEPTFEFHIPEIVEADGRTKYSDIYFHVSLDGPKRFLWGPYWIEVPGKYRQSTGGGWLAETRQAAPIIHVNGPLTMGFNKEPVLRRGATVQLDAWIGTPGYGHDRPTKVQYESGPAKDDQSKFGVPSGIHPVAEIEFPSGKPDAKPMRIKATLDRRH